MSAVCGRSWELQTVAPRRQQRRRPPAQPQRGKAEAGRRKKRLFALAVIRRHRIPWFGCMQSAILTAQATAVSQHHLGVPQVQCFICYDDFVASEGLSAACNHPFCKDCWHSYVATAVSSGPSCLDLRCPQPKCHAVVSSCFLNHHSYTGEEASKNNMVASYSFPSQRSQLAQAGPKLACSRMHMFPFYVLQQFTRDLAATWHEPSMAAHCQCAMQVKTALGFPWLRSSVQCCTGASRTGGGGAEQQGGGKD